MEQIDKAQRAIGNARQHVVAGDYRVRARHRVDLDAARASLEQKGVKLDDLVEIPDMVRLTTFYDPDGNPWMFAQSLRPDPA